MKAALVHAEPCGTQGGDVGPLEVGRNPVDDLAAHRLPAPRLPELPTLDRMADVHGAPALPLALLVGARAREANDSSDHRAVSGWL